LGGGGGGLGSDVGVAAGCDIGTGRARVPRPFLAALSILLRPDLGASSSSSSSAAAAAAVVGSAEMGDFCGALSLSVSGVADLWREILYVIIQRRSLAAGTVSVSTSPAPNITRHNSYHYDRL